MRLHGNNGYVKRKLSILFYFYAENDYFLFSCLQYPQLFLKF